MADGGDGAGAVHEVTLLVRATCGSCERVRRQILPVCAAAGAPLEVVDVDLGGDPSLAVEFGDRVPVVLVDGEEFACWEVEDAELAEELAR